MKKLNREFRSVNKATDVLSFPQGDKIILGDVVISLDMVSKQAKSRGVKRDEEIKMLLVHGLLHLMGHEHSSMKNFEKMKKKQDKLLKEIL